jgi:hypothetical protein
MMTKYPFGLAVRIRGDAVTGYRVQYTFNYHQYLFFLTHWYDDCCENIITLKAAKTYALEKYNIMLTNKIRDIEWRQRQKKKDIVVWGYPGENFEK